MHERFWMRMVLAFLLFVLAGTFGLIFLLNATFQKQSHSEFEALAAMNADFIRNLHLPTTERLAEHLTRMLGVKVTFQRLTAPDRHHEAVTVPLDSGQEMTLIRERPTLRTVLLRPVTIGSVAVFWGLWFALAWAVIRPYLQAQRLAVLGQISTSLAHQIRNPVAAIRLHGQLLQRTEPETAALIVDQTTTIEGLLNQWMFLARPEPPRKTQVALGPLLQQTVRLLVPSADHAQVKLELKLEKDRHIQADARRLGQVFHNIILNAIQAMSTGGTLTISLDDSAITFADTGPGFSARALDRWSEMLFSEKEGGMGIGLSVAQEIIRAHNGHMRVTNRPEGGALVRIEL